MTKDGITVAAFTGGVNVPSARYRVRQYVSELRKYGVSLTEFAPKLGTYPVGPRILRPAWAVCSLSERSLHVLGAREFDLTLLQREMLSTLLTLEPLTKTPRVLDVDDAIWTRREGQSVSALVKLCRSVICGNDFLAEHFSRYGVNVSVVPTAIDVDLYRPLETNRERTHRIIGWSGTSGGFQYLFDIEDALAQVLRMFSDARLRIISDKRPDFRKIPSHKIEFVQWTPGIEVSAIQTIDVGIMPLRNTVWEQGKCSLKMLAYMACGIPVVVSKVGTNNQILKLGEVGFGAETYFEWVCSLSDFLANTEKARETGKAGREVVSRFFSTEVQAPIIAEVLKHATT